MESLTHYDELIFVVGFWSSSRWNEWDKCYNKSLSVMMIYVNYVLETISCIVWGVKEWFTGSSKGIYKIWNGVKWKKLRFLRDISR